MKESDSPPSDALQQIGGEAADLSVTIASKLIQPSLSRKTTRISEERAGGAPRH
jgi:F0F1-type ATP synthase membrane subunit b/b'